MFTERVNGFLMLQVSNYIILTMKKTKLISTIAYAIASITNFSAQLQAQTTEPHSNILEPTQLAGFQQPPPPDDAPDGRRRGTGSRSSLDNSVTITPLIPSDSWGYTTSENPKIWAYIDYSSARQNKQIPGRFSLQDPSTNKKMSPGLIFVTLPRKSGAFSIRVPYLPPNKMYRWYLVINDSEDGGVFVDGWVRRVEDRELKHQLAQAKTAREHYSLYAQQGLWYDALNEAAEIRCNNPQNSSLNDPLAILLKAVQLAEIAQTPVMCL